MSQRQVKHDGEAAAFGANRGSPRRLTAVSLLLLLAVACLGLPGDFVPAARRLAAAISPTAGAQTVPPPSSPSKEYIYAGGRLVATEEPTNDAAFVRQTVPPSMVAGRSYTVPVVMKNTGTSTWTNAAGYALGSQNPPDNMTWGLSRVVLPAPVAPGAEVTFNVTVTAPATPDAYNFQWRMVQGAAGWFGTATTNESVTVTEQPSPRLGILSAGQTAPVNLTAEGTQDWVHWGLGSAADLDRKAAVATQISHYRVVGPSPSASTYGDLSYAHTWTDGTPTPAATATTGVFVSGAAGNGFEVTAPADTNLRTLKLYVGAWRAQGQLEARLSDNSVPPQSAWLYATQGTVNYVYTISYRAASAGQTLTLSYTLKESYNASYGNVTLQAAALRLGEPVMPPATDAAFVSQSVPTSMVAGQRYPVSVRMRNTGFHNWFWAAPENKGFRLGSQNPQDNMTWGLNRAVPPWQWATGSGHEVTYAFTVTAPATPGTYNFQWRMVCEGEAAGLNGWFGEYTPNIPVTVLPRASGGSLSGGGGAAPSGGSVNLTAEGTQDWMHWGLGSAASFNSKAGVAPQISNYKVLGTGAVSRLADLAYAHAWTDGTPTQGATATTGVFVSGDPGNGFEVTAPADTTTRTLKLYVGAWQAQGQLEAQLSDGSAAGYTDTSVVASAGTVNYVYTISYRAASAGQTLTVTYTLKNYINNTYGNVTLQAATLAGEVGAPPDQGPAPTNLLATANTSTAVEVTWTAPATTSVVSRYVVERAQSIGAFVPVASNVTTTTFIDTGASVGTAYLYRVKAVYESGEQSDYSNEDLATTVIFSETLTPRVTKIQAVHLVELRQAVTAVRALVPGLGQTTWTYPDPVSSPPEQRRKIYLEDATDLRTNLDAALSRLGRYEPYPAAPPLARGAVVAAEHFNQIRQRVK